MQLLKNGCLALIVTIISSFVLSCPARADAIADYNNGAGFFERGMYLTAIQWFDKAIAYNKKGFVDPYINKGVCLQKLGYHDRAIHCYSEALRVNPNIAVAYQNRGTAYLRIDKYAESLRDLNKAISMPKASALSAVTVYIDRGRAYAGLGRWKESFADFDYVMSIQATSGDMQKLRLAAAREKQKAQTLMAKAGRGSNNTSRSSTANPSATSGTTSQSSTQATPSTSSTNPVAGTSNSQTSAAPSSSSTSSADPVAASPQTSTTPSGSPSPSSGSSSQTISPPSNSPPATSSSNSESSKAPTNTSAPNSP